jgi:hypothetical protein
MLCFGMGGVRTSGAATAQRSVTVQLGVLNEKFYNATTVWFNSLR